MIASLKLQNVHDTKRQLSQCARNDLPVMMSSEGKRKGSLTRGASPAHLTSKHYVPFWAQCLGGCGLGEFLYPLGHGLPMAQQGLRIISEWRDTVPKGI
ncbi:hypothetical protein A2U01_0005997 [Trifolium medium]|uniref:Uncharacterized protein n=1 Tax=Trifolium medium TaxID=97028 RepID=A0A392MDC0_9FABA|nr:hypothetical protein [Trifolium medium]